MDHDPYLPSGPSSPPPADNPPAEREMIDDTSVGAANAPDVTLKEVVFERDVVRRVIDLLDRYHNEAGHIARRHRCNSGLPVGVAWRTCFQMRRVDKAELLTLLCAVGVEQFSTSPCEPFLPDRHEEFDRTPQSPLVGIRRVERSTRPGYRRLDDHRVVRREGVTVYVDPLPTNLP